MRLHRAQPPCAPFDLAASQASDALHRRAACLVTVLLVRPLAASSQLLRPLLTSGSASAASGFRPQGQISPGKNAILHRTTVAFTSPGPWPQELCSHMPARPGRRRLRCASCTSAHGLRSTLPPHARSPSRSCASLASLWPARPGTLTPKIAPMLGAHGKRGRLPPLGTAQLKLRPLRPVPSTPGCSARSGGHPATPTRSLGHSRRRSGCSGSRH